MNRMSPPTHALLSGDMCGHPEGVHDARAVDCAEFVHRQNGSEIIREEILLTQRAPVRSSECLTQRRAFVTSQAPKPQRDGIPLDHVLELLLGEVCKFVNQPRALVDFPSSSIVV